MMLEAGKPYVMTFSLDVIPGRVLFLTGSDFDVSSVNLGSVVIPIADVAIREANKDDLNPCRKFSVKQ